MKHIKTYKEQIFESAYTSDDKVMILYKVPGTDKREIVPVQIVNKLQGSDSYLVSFNIEMNPFANQLDIVVPASKIIGPYTELDEPTNPAYLSQQPVGTDYNKVGDQGGGGQSNDVSLPNS